MPIILDTSLKKDSQRLPYADNIGTSYRNTTWTPVLECIVFIGSLEYNKSIDQKGPLFGCSEKLNEHLMCN